MVAHDDQHIPLERWVGRQLGEISRGAADAREAVTRDGERAALVIGHVLAHGRHEPGACGTCDAGRAWLEEWLAGRADAPEALAEVERVADMGAAEYARHWRRGLVHRRGIGYGQHAHLQRHLGALRRAARAGRA